MKTLWLLAQGLIAVAYPQDEGELDESPETATVEPDDRPVGPPVSRRSLSDRGIEIGTRYKLGLGVAAGFPPSATLRYLADPRRGVSLHVAPTMVTTGIHLRVQYEQRVAELRNWAFGSLGLTWNVGVVVAVVFGQEVGAQPVRPGLTTGLGVELSFGVAPAAVFAEVAPVLYPLDLVPATRSAFLPAGLNLVVGARWYFDVGRRDGGTTPRRRPSTTRTP